MNRPHLGEEASKKKVGTSIAQHSLLSVSPSKAALRTDTGLRPRPEARLMGYTKSEPSSSSESQLCAGDTKSVQRSSLTWLESYNEGGGGGGQDLKQACLISQTTLGHVATNALNKTT